MNDFLEEQPLDYIRENIIRLCVFGHEDRPLVIKNYIRYYIKNHKKFDNLRTVIEQMHPEHVEDINKLLILK